MQDVFVGWSARIQDALALRTVALSIPEGTSPIRKKQPIVMNATQKSAA